MHSPTSRIRTALFGAGLIGFALTAAANAVRLPSQDAWSDARGHAATASVDSSAAIWYNPAGLRHVEHDDVRIEPAELTINEHFTSDTGAKTEESSKHFFTPSAYAAHRLSPSVIVGVGALAPYGLSSDWPVTSGFGGLATKNELTFHTGVATVAWQPTPSFGIGASAEYSTLKANLNRLTPVAPGVISSFNFTGNDHAFSGNIGAQWDIDAQSSIGILYQLPTKFSLNGSATLTGVATVPGHVSPWRFGDNLAVGYRYRFAPDWDVEVGVDWTFWNGAGTVHLDAGPLSTALPLEWKNSAYYNFGLEHRLNADWRVAAGYQYSQNSVPDAALNPSLPDSDRHIFDLGVERAFGVWKIQLYVEQSLKSDRRVTAGTPNGVGGTYSGTFTNRYTLVGCSIGAAW